MVDMAEAFRRLEEEELTECDVCGKEFYIPPFYESVCDDCLSGVDPVRYPG